MSLTFQEYFVRFERAAIRHKAHLTPLSNGGCIARFGIGPCFAIMSGLHGDEGSGPLSILEWLEALPVETPLRHQFWIAPLVNDDGWDQGKREWQNLDLNRSFNGAAPDFLATIMMDLEIARPDLFLDLHEDSYYEGPYLFQFTGDTHPLVTQLASNLDFETEPWSDLAAWETASETYVRRLGCDYTVTIEVPPVWPLEKRIQKNIQVITWLQENVMLNDRSANQLTQISMI